MCVYACGHFVFLVCKIDDRIYLIAFVVKIKSVNKGRILKTLPGKCQPLYYYLPDSFTDLWSKADVSIVEHLQKGICSGCG